MAIPMNNLKEPKNYVSSAIPGVNGESKNAPYGPKACAYEDITSFKAWGDMHNVSKSGFAVGKTSGPMANGMGESLAKPAQGKK